MLVLTLLATANFAKAATGVFGSLEIRTNATQGLGEWRKLLTRLGREQKLYASCDTGQPDCPSYLRQWRQHLKDWAGADILSQLENVNGYINASIHYADDARAMGRNDAWSTPAVSLKGRGDCEDYAIAKYESLRALGVPEKNLRLVIVNDTLRKLGHAVLAVNTGKGLYILDNLKPHPYLDARVSHYAPVYSVNRTGRWINVATRKVEPADIALRGEIDIPVSVSDRLKPSVGGADEVVTLRPSLALEPATGIGALPPRK